ncbi:hypothetical protein Fluta_3015 [Fluviicola taffensis DSM 16823]|uniref:DUF2892 domain-containing protein n=1 Tax=Fluviicola taffensis (strain DSM 16823 / NCIMB 13979 / RW262) TaxID=755732 RepID=F2IJT5_FLUTR|nr:hypothetical protein Fluta_3015 [Fluviicola taffensis DSM 16823]
MISRVFTGWHLVRLLYVVAGIGIIIASSAERQWFGIILGGYFTVIAIFGIGCATGNCRVPKEK